MFTLMFQSFSPTFLEKKIEVFNTFTCCPDISHNLLSALIVACMLFVITFPNKSKSLVNIICDIIGHVCPICISFQSPLAISYIIRCVNSCRQSTNKYGDMGFPWWSPYFGRKYSTMLPFQSMLVLTEAIHCIITCLISSCIPTSSRTFYYKTTPHSIICFIKIHFDCIISHPTSHFLHGMCCLKMHSVTCKWTCS